MQKDVSWGSFGYCTCWAYLATADVASKRKGGHGSDMRTYGRVKMSFVESWRTPGTNWIGSWVDPTTVLNICEHIKPSHACYESRLAGGGGGMSCNMDTTLIQPHRIFKTHRTKNKTTNVVIQQNSRKLLVMDILMSETCWTHKKWNKIASGIKLVFYSSTITMMHGPINIRSVNKFAKSNCALRNRCLYK